jgi:hypothetical protein
MSDQPTLETWEMKAKRLALELQAVRSEPYSSTKAQRAAYSHARYAMQRHIESVEA